GKSTVFRFLQFAVKHVAKTSTGLVNFGDLHQFDLRAVWQQNPQGVVRGVLSFSPPPNPTVDLRTLAPDGALCHGEGWRLHIEIKPREQQWVYCTTPAVHTKGQWEPIFRLADTPDHRLEIRGAGGQYGPVPGNDTQRAQQPLTPYAQVFQQ